MKFPEKSQKLNKPFEAENLDIKRYLYLINKHKLLIIVSFVVAVLLTFLWLVKQEPVWRVISDIQVASGMSMPMGDVYREIAGSYIHGQIQILDSKNLKDRVEKKILETDWVDKISKEKLEPERDFRVVRGSDIIEISIDHINKDYAMFYNEILLKEFLKFKQEKKGFSAEIALSELTKQTEKLEKEIKSIEQEILSFEKDHDIIAHDISGNLPAKRVTDLQNKLAEIITQKDIIRTHQEEFKKNADPYLIGDLLNRLNAISIIIPQENVKETNNPSSNSSQIPNSFQMPTHFLSEFELKEYRDLKKQKEKINLELIKNSQIYKENHPKVKKLKEESGQIDKRIVGVIESLKERLDSRYKTLELEEKSMKNSLDEWKRKTIDMRRLMTEFENLESELERKRKFYTTLINRANEIDFASGFKREMVQVIEEPYVLPKPVKPNKRKIILFGCALGLGLGLGLALTIEYLNDTVRSNEELGRLVPVPMLAFIPNFLEFENKKPEDKIISPGSKQNMVLETYRRLRTSVIFSSTERELKTILITSSVPSEGKTITAVNLAISFAMIGIKTLLMDCDLRRGALHSYFKKEKKQGLSSYLVGNDGLENIIKTTGIENLDIIPCGPFPPNPPELFSSKAMDDLMSKICDMYERIIIDSPPLLNVADSIILGAKVKGTILVIHGGKTSRALIKHSSEMLTTNHINFIGTIINNLAVKKFDYYSRSYYHYDYKHYYHKGEEKKK